MASGRSERVYHQDYIARIRYSNTLPPPPNPPKLLDIPGTGIASNNYTSASYALKLAREQPLNIEADAELGMPIDLVGLPGVFDGDESAIMAQDPPPSLHPKDRALLKPLSALGKPTAMNSGVSFLRRTEYISSNAAAVQRFESSTSKDLLRVRNDPKRRKAPPVNRDDPINIIRSLVKGFDLAYPEDAYTGPDSETNIRGAPITEADRSAWKKPKHPTKPNLTLLDAYPLLPDMDALPMTGDYQIVKFSTNPVAQSDSYDQRLDSALLRPLGADLALHEERMAAHKADPTMPKPLPEWDYDLFLAEHETSIRGIKRKFDPNDAQNDDPSLYETEADGESCFQFQRIREYETYQQAGDADNAYGDTVALALHDTGDRLEKGAYFYPVKQRTNLRPKRKTPGPPEEGRLEHVDVLHVNVRDPNSDEAAMRSEAQAALDPTTESV
ncbi:Paf1 complex protein, partial [Aureobasidium melanogenum]